MNDLEKFKEREEPERALAIQEPSFLDVVERLASRPDIDPEKIKQIMEIQEHVVDRQARQDYNTALSKVQSQIRVVVKNATGDNNRYATYDKVVAEVSPIYTAEGFSVSMYEGEAKKEDHLRIMADVGHSGGWTETRWAEIPNDGKGAKGNAVMSKVHATGSAFTYGKRYLLCLIFNIPTGDDDDGKAAGGQVDEFITEEQAIIIKEALESPNQNEARFLKYMKVECPEEILSKDLKKAMGTINSTEREAEKAVEREPGEEG